MCYSNGQNKGEIMQDQIFEYIRRRKGGKTIKVGIVLALTDEDHGVIKVGWSKCNFSVQHGDIFNASKGIELAKSRARKETPTTTPLPSCIRKQYRQFCARAVRYFKNAHTMIMDTPA